MSRSKIKVYGALWCGDCRRSKAFLDRNDVDYEWIDTDQDPAGHDYVVQVNNGKRIIPTIVFADGSILTEPSDFELAAKLGIA